MMNPDDHGHDRDLRGQEPPGAGPGDPGHDYGVQGGPAQLGIIFPAQAQVTQHSQLRHLTCSLQRNIEIQKGFSYKDFKF